VRELASLVVQRPNDSAARLGLVSRGTDAEGTPVTFGIIQRYVIGEVARAFALALLTMTIIFVLFMVMAEASKLGLSPRDIATLIPYVIPGTFPYTVPVSVLFAVTVVYGRLASDNEIIAVKTAGLSAWTMLWPSVLLGGVLTGILYFMSGDTIPKANHSARMAIFKNFEEMFYKTLKKDRELNSPKLPFQIKVRDVDISTKTMWMATFKHRAKGGAANTPDMIVQARKARIFFDMDEGVARVYLDGAEISSGGKHDDVALINDNILKMDLPDKSNPDLDKRIQEWTTVEMVAQQAQFRRLRARERKRQAMGAALAIASGRLQQIKWKEVQTAFTDHGYWGRKLSEFETEKQLRVAQSFGSLMFVILGAPVGILFARRDFLSAFISCFVPIIIVYYPLMLLGVNVGKEDILNPTLALWSGNLVLAVLAGFVLPPVFKH
jgi:lipopolysaccharide export system permease protein